MIVHINTGTVCKNTSTAFYVQYHRCHEVIFSFHHQICCTGIISGDYHFILQESVLKLFSLWHNSGILVLFLRGLMKMDCQRYHRDLLSYFSSRPQVSQASPPLLWPSWRFTCLRGWKVPVSDCQARGWYSGCYQCHTLHVRWCPLFLQHISFYCGISDICTYTPMVQVMSTFKLLFTYWLLQLYWYEDINPLLCSQCCLSLLAGRKPVLLPITIFVQHEIFVSSTSSARVVWHLSTVHLERVLLFSTVLYFTPLQSVALCWDI